jgi:hypothetical protein
MSSPQGRIEQTDPQAYQRKLIGLVGDRNPFEVLGSTPEVLGGMLRDKPAQLLRQRPYAGKWTPNEIVGHLMDIEWVQGFRARTILCDERPRIMPMDQDRWVAVQQHNEREPAELLAAFTQLRFLNLTMWRQVKPAELERVGLHAERGEEKLGFMLRMCAGHDLSHIDQIQRYLAAIEQQA